METSSSAQGSSLGREHTSQNTQSEASNVLVRNAEDIRKIKELEAKIAEMTTAMRAVDLLRDTNDVQIIPEKLKENADVKHNAYEEICATESKESLYNAIMGCTPTVFKGDDDDPLVCQRWIRGMERTFDFHGVPEDQKVNYAIPELACLARDWWKAVSWVLTEETCSQLTWKMFVEKLTNRFCSMMTSRDKKYIDKIIELEEQLAQARWSIKKFESSKSVQNQQPMNIIFRNDSCQIPENQENTSMNYLSERDVINLYVDALPLEYRPSVRRQATLKLAMEKAIELERKFDASLAVKKIKGKRKQEDQSGSSSKKQKAECGRCSKKRKIQLCKDCRSYHDGPCNINTMRCLRCGKLGHKKKECHGKELICYECHETGHYARECTKPRDNDRGKGKKKATPET